MNKRMRRLLLFLCIIIALAFGIKKLSIVSYRPVLVFDEKTKHDITDMAVLKGGILATFDGDALIFNNGSDKKIVDRMGEGQKAFFGEKDAMLYDESIKKVTVFSPDGKERQSYYIEGELFRADVQNGVRLFHCRYDDGEKLFIATDSGSLNSVFETKNYILDFKFKDEKHFVITELSNAANGYKTTVYVENGKRDKERMENTEFPMEVAMRIVEGRYPVIVTEKHLYGLGKELMTEKSPILSDVIYHRNKLYTLHSGILSRHGRDLKEIDRRVMEGNVDHLASVGEELFAYGNRELLGRADSDHPYHIRFGDTQEKVQVKDGYIATYGSKHIALYQLKPRLFRSKTIETLKSED